jgi:hypothetical protein
MCGAGVETWVDKVFVQGKDIGFLCQTGYSQGI